MQRAFDFSVGAGHTAERLRVILRIDLLDLAVGVFLQPAAFDDIRTFETHFLVRTETEEFLGRILHEVLALDPKFAGEGHLMHPLLGILRIVGHLHHLGLLLGIVVED